MEYNINVSCYFWKAEVGNFIRTLDMDQKHSMKSEPSGWYYGKFRQGLMKRFYYLINQ